MVDLSTRAHGDAAARARRRSSLVSRAATAYWRRGHQHFLDRLPAYQQMPYLDLDLRSLPRTVRDQLKDALFRRRHRDNDVPWLTPDSIDMLETVLRPTDLGLEYGAGASTPWFAARCGELRSVEATREWYEVTQARLDAGGFTNTRLELIDADILGADTEEHIEAYVNAHPDLVPGTLDWVLIDGEYRDRTAQRAISLLRPGGLLIFDDVNLYLPVPVRGGPWRVEEPATPLWKDLYEEISQWRLIWTTDGVKDTAIYLKP